MFFFGHVGNKKTVMKYHESCNAALHAVEAQCPLNGNAACLADHGVYTEKEKTQCETLVVCTVSGTSDIFYTCLRENVPSPAVQIVLGMPRFGVPSRVIN